MFLRKMDFSHYSNNLNVGWSIHHYVESECSLIPENAGSSSSELCNELGIGLSQNL